MVKTVPKASVGTLNIDSFNPSIMEETVKGSSMEHVQLASGRFQAHLLGAQLGVERLDFGSYNLPLHAVGQMPDTHITLGAVLSSDGFGTLNGREISKAVPVIMNEGAELNYILAPGSEWVAFQLDRSTLEALEIDFPDKLNGLAKFDPQDEQDILTCLQHSISTLHEVGAKGHSIKSPDKFVEKIFASILDAYSEALQNASLRSHSQTGYPKNSLQMTKRTIDYFDAYYGGIILISKLCADLGITQKTLQRAFLKHCGMTPKRYLDYFRLSKVRNKLLQCKKDNRSITDIATECGINHLSRFASLYHETYGELPSDTIRQSSRYLAIKNSVSK